MHHAEAAAFLNQKGGVGKTTTVANVGAGLTILGNRVLIVDLDPQGHLTRFLGIAQDEVHRTIYDVLRGEIPPQQAVIKRTLKARVHIGDRDAELSLSVIPATLDFAEAEMTLSRATDRELLLKRAIASIGDDYDHILFDCSPSLGLISTNALAAARTVFVPVQTEYLALESLENLLTKIESVSARLNPGLEIGGLIATRFDGRKVLSRTVVQTLRERFGAMLLGTIIRDNIDLAESPSAGKDIFSYSPRSHGSEDYLNLSIEIMDRLATVGEIDSSVLDGFESHAGGAV